MVANIIYKRITDNWKENVKFLFITCNEEQEIIFYYCCSTLFEMTGDRLQYKELCVTRNYVTNRDILCVTRNYVTNRDIRRYAKQYQIKIGR